jgi:FkbM family methyltransferase
MQRLLGGSALIGIDVGGAKGLQPHWWTFHGSADFYVFEPHPESFEEIKMLYANSEYPEMYRVLPYGLSGTGGIRTLYKLNAPTGSSLLPIDLNSEFVNENDSYIFPIREERINTRTLKEIMIENKEERVDLIKLDVQGAELEILKGLGDERLDQLLLIELEVGFAHEHIGAPTFAEVDTFMSSRGLQLFDVSVARAHRSKGGDSSWYQERVFGVHGKSPKISARLWEFDAVYFRDPKPMIAKKDADGIRRLLACYCAYNFFSEAYYLTEKSESAGLFSEETSKDIKKVLVDWHRALHYRFYHKPTWFFNKVRAINRPLHLGRESTWKQYMWFDYPNG